MTYLKARETPIEIVEQSSTELILRKGQPRKIETQRRIRRVIQNAIFWLVGFAALSILAPPLFHRLLDTLRGLLFLNLAYLSDFYSLSILIPLAYMGLVSFFALFRPFTEIWKFNIIDNQLTQTVQGALTQKVIRYSLAEITTVELNEITGVEYDEVAYEVILHLQSQKKGLRLSATPFVMAQRDRAITRVQQREIANAIYQLLHTKNRQVTLQDNATGDNTIPKPVDWQAELSNVKEGFQDIVKIGKAFKKGKKARKKGQLQLAQAYDRAVTATKTAEANKNDQNAQQALDRAIKDLIQAAEATEKN